METNTPTETYILWRPPAETYILRPTETYILWRPYRD